MTALIIPTINHTDLVLHCLEAVKRFSKDWHAFIVDDGSAPPVQNKLREKLHANVDANLYTLICRAKNGGFIGAVNTVLSKFQSGEIDVSRFSQIILLNNDAEFTSDVCGVAKRVFKEKREVGIIGGALKFPNGTIQHVGMEISAPGVFKHIDKGAIESPRLAESAFMPAVTGAVFAIRKECFESVGLLDSSFFLACDDTDYCLRAWQKNWQVYYAHDMTALHIEGFTRGNTPQTKSIGKRAEWYEKEKATIKIFHEKWKAFEWRALVERVRALNGESVPQTELPQRKIEIGCGANPQPGYIHLDARPLRGVDIVHDFSKDVLPFEDNSVGEVLSNHSIEHVSYRALPFVLKEWHRVLAPGGRLFLRTPDLEFICKTYLAGKTTPESKGDEEYIKQHLHSEVSPAWWANVKLFAGQDYPGNFHYLCFDFAMLQALLEKYGFRRVKRLNIQPVFSPGEIQCEAFK